LKRIPIFKLFVILIYAIASISLFAKKDMDKRRLVSRTYLPEKDWTQINGNFGVIVAVSKPK
jgi:hypothetical protein